MPPQVATTQRSMDRDPPPQNERSRWGQLSYKTSDAQLHFEKRQMMDDRPEESLGFGRWLLIALAGLENLYVFAVAIGGAFGVLDAVLVGIGVYVLAVFVYVEFELLAELRGR